MPRSVLTLAAQPERGPRAFTISFLNRKGCLWETCRSLIPEKLRFMKCLLYRVVGLFCLMAMQAFGGSIVINEIMFHPAPAVPETNGLDWIELYNKSTNAVSLNAQVRTFMGVC